MIDRKRMLYSLYFPALTALLLWGMKLFELSTGVSMVQLGVLPRDWRGLLGIVTSPLIHSDLKHLFNNSIPLFIITWLLIYYYREISYKVFFLVWIITGIWVWFGARDAFHIGASGVVYGIISFIFFSGFFRRHPALMTISLLMVFLYGSMIWGIFPFVPDVSWESHLSGGVAGLILSIYFLKQGPQRKTYDWENENDESDAELTMDPQENNKIEPDK